MARFDKTHCSQCGREFGPGEHGYSHCDDHVRDAAPELLAAILNSTAPWTPAMRAAIAKATGTP